MSPFTSIASRTLGFLPSSTAIAATCWAWTRHRHVPRWKRSGDQMPSGRHLSHGEARCAINDNRYQWNGCNQMENKMDRLRGKVILISGGARGQGAAEARLFVAEGARVVIGDVLEAEGRQLASELGPSAVFVRQDVTQERDWGAAINAAETLGGLHGLVNNAGIYQPCSLTETDTELF